MPDVRITCDNFCIGSVRVPKGSVITLPQIKIDYLVLQKRGVLVGDEPEQKEEGYERKDMEAESAPATPPALKRRTYKRRDRVAKE